MTSQYETLTAPPTGLCACRLGGEAVHIHAISPRSVTLRLSGDAPCGALELYLYRAERGDYERHVLSYTQAGEAQRMDGAALLRLCFEDAACARAIRRTMADYARCLETKSTLGASAWAGEICGYPAHLDEDFSPSLQAQRQEWFSQLSPLPQPPGDVQLAVALNCPELWKLYLSLPLADFMAVYARSRQLPPKWLPAALPRRLYVGNPYCRFLFPEEDVLRAIAQKAGKEGLLLTLCTAELRAGGEATADRQIVLAAELGSELEINDWGMLRRAAGRTPLLLGTQLNRRRKDPRMQYKPGMDASLLAQNSLNSPQWRAYLEELGVIRYEYEACGLPTCLPEAHCSLHLPFYQTNTSLWCPLQALCLRGERGAQQPQADCAHWCEENALLYPRHLQMLGRWNSLLALADTPRPEDLAGYDRWVLNF